MHKIIGMNNFYLFLQIYLQVYEAFNMLQMMFHEATACHVITELSDLLSIFSELVKAVRLQNRSTTSSLKTNSETDSSGAGPTISTPSSVSEAPNSPNKDWRHLISRWKDMGDMTTRLLTLCNSYVPAELREICLMCVKEMLMLWPTDMLTLLVPLLHRSHNSASESTENMTLGPYFPRYLYLLYV